jgi:hypothetical protein
MKNKLLTILFILIGTFGVKADFYYLSSEAASGVLSYFGAPSTTYYYSDYCVCLANNPSYGGWVGQFDNSYITGGNGATAIAFFVRMDAELVFIYEDESSTGESGKEYWVPKACIEGVGFMYYPTYNITSGYSRKVLVRIIKNSFDDYYDGWNEYDFHYIRGIWWGSYN